MLRGLPSFGLRHARSKVVLQAMEKGSWGSFRLLRKEAPGDTWKQTEFRSSRDTTLHTATVRDCIRTYVRTNDIYIYIYIYIYLYMEDM